MEATEKKVSINEQSINVTNPFMAQAMQKDTSFNFHGNREFSENIRYSPKSNVHIKGYLKSKTTGEFITDILFLQTDTGIYHTTSKSFIEKFDKLITVYPNTELDIVLIEKIGTTGNPYMGFTVM